MMQLCFHMPTEYKLFKILKFQIPSIQNTDINRAVLIIVASPKVFPVIIDGYSARAAE